MRRAVTIIELLVVLGVIATIVAITLPTVSRAKASGNATRSAANARSLAMAVQTYCEENKDLFPSVQKNTWYQVNESSQLMFPYWQIDTTWITVISSQLPRWKNMDVVYSPRSDARTRDSISLLSSYRYSWSMVALPAFWETDAQYQDSLVTACSTSRVAFPSQKALLWDDEVSWLGSALSRAEGNILQQVPVAFVDGSVVHRSPAKAREAVVNPALPTTPVSKLRSTLRGCAGVDY
jgi:type II secretory pathway pseudopilin PulG